MKMVHPLPLLRTVDYMGLSYETRITLRRLTIRQERKHYIVEDEGTGDFFEMPEVCIIAIEKINQFEPLDTIEISLKKEFPVEDVNILDFINQLMELDLVSEVNGEKIARKIQSNNHSGYQWIPPHLGRFFFNAYSTKIYIGSLIASLLLILSNPSLFPNYQDFFVYDLMIKNVAVWLLLTFSLVVLHELGHVFAVRSENLPAKIEIGHRLFFVVLETDMSRVWTLPVKKRNQLFLAGMYVDFLLLFLALTAQFFTIESSVLTGFLKLIVLDTFIRLIYQVCVFMKTDLYYVLENTTGCYNLMENGRNYLAKWIPNLKVENTETFEGEEKFVRPYALLYLSGVVISVVLAAYYYIPQFIFAINQIVLPGFKADMNTLRFWDSVVFLLQIALVLGLLLYSWSKKYRMSR